MTRGPRLLTPPWPVPTACFTPHTDSGVTQVMGERNQRRGGGGGIGRRNEKARKYGGGGHAFSANNPYGKRAKSDRRQFVM